MKRFLLSALLILSFAGYIWQRHSGTKAPTVSIAPSPTPSPKSNTATPEPATPTPSARVTTAPTATPAPATPPPTPKPKPKPTPTPQGKYKDGTYTGPVTDAYYGNIQVQVTISHGQIADVKFLAYPNDRQTSIEINTQAMPVLRSEAIQAQSAHVDIVSGATQTSEAFQQSLQSALDQTS